MTIMAGLNTSAVASSASMDEPILGAHRVWHRFKVDRGGADLLPLASPLVQRVVAVREVPTRGQIQTHDAIVGLQQRRVHGKVSGLPLYGWTLTPLFRVQVERCERPLLAQPLDFVYNLASSVVPLSWNALCVLVCQRGTKRRHDSL